MRPAERADLLVAGLVAVEQQKIGDPVIAGRDCDGAAIDDRDRPHQFHAKMPRLERCRGFRKQQLGRCADMDDVGSGLRDDPIDLGRVGREG
jgi:hypothetical protein